MHDALAVLFGGIIGFSLGLLGAGGSILAVPALVYGIGLPVAEAIPTSLLVVGAAAAGGAVSHLRAGRVRWATALPFGATGIGGSFLGAAMSQHLDARMLLIGFALLMLVAAVGMLRRGRRERATEGPRPAEVVATSAAAGASRDSAGVVAAAASPDLRHGREAVAGHEEGPGAERLSLALASGVGVGFLTGLFGVGGGFLIVPPMVLLLRLPMQAAVGTSLVVIVINSAAAFIAHLGHGHVAPLITVLFVGAGLVGAVAGAALSGRVPAARLTRWFAYVILAVAAFVLYRSIGG